MARAPDKRIEQAKGMYLKGMKLVEIASQLNLPEGTVRSWKNRYKWDCNVAKEKRNVAKRKKGGQPGNQNATGPPENKNAVKTGEFEALFFDCLDPEEKRLTEMVTPDKEQLLLQEIQLLTVRERRMLKRIEMLKNMEQPTADENIEPEEQVPAGMSVTGY